MKLSQGLITRALLEPTSVQSLTEPQWDLLVRQGNRANLLAKLAYVLDHAGLLPGIPVKPRHHLVAARCLSERQAHSVIWEVHCLRREMADAEVRTVLLKGAAYVVAGLPAATGRTFSDIDILVPKDKLEAVEMELGVFGWRGTHHDVYDQRYYRQWMHEIPPLRHARRGTALDVHHTILPETARVKVNTPALMQGIVPAPGMPQFYLLQPWDMLLHSATHLFHEGDFGSGLRDLFDLDALLRHFAQEPDFWSGLVPRAEVLGLTRPLFYALRYTAMLLGTPIPPEVEAAARVGRPAAWTLACMDACYTRVLRPQHASVDSVDCGLARFALYVRSHWIRMPAWLLAYHLGRKAFVRPKPPEAEKVKDNDEAA
ncbi:nucleotidyltransferase domain-containing protein [Variovorax sp. HJSM1_2]|uniref:nucleotidyltransferase domain-containing protein n=1 Tax=Variovorax sp. HJSM1_2 TaxID=3366263 RepID=UPI003BDB329A